MKNSKKVIICAAVVALGIGATAAAAAQATGADEPMASDNASEMNSSESSVTKISEPEKPIEEPEILIEESIPEDENISKAEEKKIITPEEWASRSHMPPLANVPDDFDYSGYREKIPTELGSEVYAVDDGVVCYADNNHYNGGFGGVIAIKHADNAYTLYGHLETGADYEVGVGDPVKAGQLIAYSDISGHTTIPALLYRFQDTEPVFYHPGDDIDYDNLPVVEPVEYDYVIPVEVDLFAGGTIK